MIPIIHIAPNGTIPSYHNKDNYVVSKTSVHGTSMNSISGYISGYKDRFDYYMFVTIA